MTSVRLDYRFFLYLFVCFSISSVMATGLLVYYLSQIVGSHNSNAQRLLPDEPAQLVQIWSRDPMVMRGLAGVTARHGTQVVNLTQVNFNNSCFCFVWSQYNLRNIRQYKVVISNKKVPSMAPILTDVDKRQLQFVQCHLNVSTPYLVNLTAVGEDASGASETVTGVMWTTHEVPPPPDLAKIISVTQTTITLTLPSVTLTQGPLTGIEIRIKAVATNHSLEERRPHGFFWTKLLKRHKRNSQHLQPLNVLPRTVVSSESVLQSVHGLQQGDDNMGEHLQQGDENMGKRLQQSDENMGELMQPGRLSDNSGLGLLHASRLRDDLPDMDNFSTVCQNCQDHREALEADLEAEPSPRMSVDTKTSNLFSSVNQETDSAYSSVDHKTSSVYSSVDQGTSSVYDSVDHKTSSAYSSVDQVTRTISRKKRSLLGFGRTRRRHLRADAVKEMEDGLEVDPYQTSEVRISVTGQPIRVKTGHGYFVTDHYRVRHPYFNNTLLERALKRHTRYQEAVDFVLHGKSLLNLTEFSDLDTSLLYSRLSKVMEVNKMRRGKLFLDMFEDFLFWKQERGQHLLGGDDVPPEAKLGLPPGLPVARLMTQNQSQTVTIGDDTQLDQLPNPPLEPGTEYEVVLVVLSTVVDVTKHSWISLNITTLAQQPGTTIPAPLLLLLAMAASGGLLMGLAQLILQFTSSRLTAPPAGIRQDVQTTEKEGLVQVVPVYTNWSDSVLVPSLTAGGHTQDKWTARMSGPDLGSSKKWTTLSSYSLCDDTNRTDDTNDVYHHKENCSIDNVSLDDSPPVSVNVTQGEDWSPETTHPWKSGAISVVSLAENRSNNVFSSVDLV